MDGWEGRAGGEIYIGHGGRWRVGAKMGQGEPSLEAIPVSHRRARV